MLRTICDTGFNIPRADLRSLNLRALLFVACLLSAARLHAFCFAPKIRLDDEFFTSQLVFTGSIVADQKIGLTSEGSYEGQVFSLRVQRVFRGSIRQGDIVQIYSGNDSGRFLPFEAEGGSQVGKVFLLFAFPDPEKVGRFAVDNCGNSISIGKAQPRIAELEKLPGRHGGLLYGEMIDGDEGAHIVVSTGNKRYETVSGVKGRFSLSVPPATYSVIATKPGHMYVDYDLAYKRSNSVTVPDGGSAGVAFREKGK